jgi:hypothetical protein
MTGFLEFSQCAALHKTEKIFRKQNLLPSLWDGRETPTLLGPLERTNFNLITGQPMRTEAYSVSETFFSDLYNAAHWKTESASALMGW